MKILSSYRTFQDIYTQFDENLNVLNILNDLIQSKTIFLRVHVNIDYNFVSYDKDVLKPYYFIGGWDFKEYAKKIFEAEVEDIFFILSDFKDSEDYIRLSEMYVDEFNVSPSIENILKFAHQRGDFGSFSSAEYDFDGNIVCNSSLKNYSQFHFKELAILNINNNSSVINYHGSFYTDSAGVDFSEYETIFAKLSVKHAAFNLPFYKELLLEAYSLLLEGNYKMAYFNAFAAFENFVNLKSEKDDHQGRLLDKFKDAYNNHPYEYQFAGQDSYCQLATVYKSEKFDKIRNDIAHGLDKNVIWNSKKQKKKAVEMYIFTSIAILCFTQDFKSFNELRRYLKSLLDS